ncbi:MAG: Ig-like domain-containing protein [Alistipes sp.]|nr:Ig-like domain-containing protein [Alistipes sp.]
MNRKKFIAAVLAAAMGVFSAGQSAASVMSFAEKDTSASSETALTVGDVDGNGKVDASDASMVLKEYAALSTGQSGTFTGAQNDAADIDGNGKVDASDASFILTYYAYVSIGGKLSFEEFYESSVQVKPPVTTATVTTVVANTVTTAAKPPVTTEKPVTAATKPATTAKPPITTEKPATAATKPATTAKPPITTEKPATAATKPATTAKPPVTTEKPATAATKPATTAKPPVTTEKLVTAATKPVTTIVKPLTTAKPVTTVPVVTADPKRVADIRLSRTEMTLTVGTGDLSARVTMLPITAEDVREIWSTSDESVAIVDDQGWVQAVGEGKCTIRVTSVDNPEVYAEIAVETIDTTSVKDIRVSRTEMTVRVGEGDLSARVTMLPQTAANKGEIWSCSNEEIAVVDNEGWVVGKKAGVCAITVRSVDNPAVFAVIAVSVVDDSAPVTTVTEPPVTPVTTVTTEAPPVTAPADDVTGINIGNDEIEISIGEKYTVSAEVVPDTAKNKKLTWLSRSEDVAVVDENGCITGVSAGVTVVTVKSDENPDIKANIVVTVNSHIKVQSITLSDYSFTVPVGGRALSWVTMSPADATNVDEMWESSDASVAAVDRYGWITGVSAGECTITVISVDNPSVKAEIAVTIVEEGSSPEPTVDFSSIVPGKSDDNNIAFMTPFPEGYEGRYVIDYVITDENGDVTTISSSTIVLPAMKSMTLKLTAAANNFKATAYLTNLTNGKQAEIGTYEFSLKPRDAKTLSEDIISAFENVQ